MGSQGSGAGPPSAAGGGDAGAPAGDSAALEVRASVVIPNPEGMHARPCHGLVSLARRYSSELRVSSQGREVSGGSILELMTLAAGCGTELVFVARGPDAPQLMERLLAFVSSGFEDRG
jgi:phosphocarrier protein HPr